jgi:hypothetical protein
MFKFSTKQHSRPMSSDSSSPALLAILTGGPTRTTPRRSRSSDSTASADSALGRILSGGKTTLDSKHTPTYVVKSEQRCDMQNLNEGFQRAKALEQLVQEGLIIVHDKRRKERKTPRRTKSDDGASVKSYRSGGSGRSLGRSSTNNA